MLKQNKSKKKKLRVVSRGMSKFPEYGAKEFDIFKRLDTPQKIQDFLEKMPFNFEKSGDTNRSPLETLRAGQAHCMEGAMLAAAIFWYHGEKPLLLDLRTIHDDFDHVVTLFKRDGLWGAVSKTNHAVLRYRDPIYNSVRELVMSYFHEYFLNNGEKTLREYSAPFDMSKLDPAWPISPKNLWYLVTALDKSTHFKILPSPSSVKNLRKASAVEIKAGKIVEYKKR